MAVLNPQDYRYKRFTHDTHYLQIAAGLWDWNGVAGGVGVTGYQFGNNGFLNLKLCIPAPGVVKEVWVTTIGATDGTAAEVSFDIFNGDYVTSVLSTPVLGSHMGASGSTEINYIGIDDDGYTSTGGSATSVTLVPANCVFQEAGHIILQPIYVDEAVDAKFYNLSFGVLFQPFAQEGGDAWIKPGA